MPDGVFQQHAVLFFVNTKNKYLMQHNNSKNAWNIRNGIRPRERRRWHRHARRLKGACQR